MGIKERLWRCFRHVKGSPIYGRHVVVLLVVHLTIGYRRLRDLDYYHVRVRFGIPSAWELRYFRHKNQQVMDQ